MGPPQNNLPPANTTQTQPRDTGPASAGRSVGRWGRLWNSFRESFTKLIRATIQCTPGHTSSGGREGEVVEYRGVQTGGHPAGGEVAIPAITPNNRDVLIPPSQTHGSHVAPHEQGTSGKQHSAVPRPSSTTPQLVSSSPSPALPSNDTSNERATQRDEQKLDHNHRDENGAGNAGDHSDDDGSRENVLESDYNGPPSLKSVSSKDSVPTTSKSRTERMPDDGQNGNQRTERM